MRFWTSKRQQFGTTVKRIQKQVLRISEKFDDLSNVYEVFSDKATLNDILSTAIEIMIPEYVLCSSFKFTMPSIKFELLDSSEKFQQIINNFLGQELLQNTSLPVNFNVTPQKQ